MRQELRDSRIEPEPTLGRLEARKRRLERSVEELREKIAEVTEQIERLVGVGEAEM